MCFVTSSYQVSFLEIPNYTIPRKEIWYSLRNVKLSYIDNNLAAISQTLII